MRIIGIDPGANFTGIAVLEATGEFSFWAESDDPTDIWRVISGFVGTDTVVILEDILGSGRRDEYIQRTIKILGYIEFRCNEARVKVVLVPQQARLANVKNVPKEIRRKDERSAAAHALSYRERQQLDRDKHRRGSHGRGRTPPIPDPG